MRPQLRCRMAQMRRPLRIASRTLARVLRARRRRACRIGAAARVMRVAPAVVRAGGAVVLCRHGGRSRARSRTWLRSGCQSRIRSRHRRRVCAGTRRGIGTRRRSGISRRCISRRSRRHCRRHARVTTHMTQMRPQLRCRMTQMRRPLRIAIRTLARVLRTCRRRACRIGAAARVMRVAPAVVRAGDAMVLCR
jgi:hypothetical protein